MINKLFILVLILFTACNTQSNDGSNGNGVVEIPPSNSHEGDTANIIKTFISLNSQNYIQQNRDNRFDCLLTSNGDTIVKSHTYYSQIEFLDIDEDGNQDLRVFIISNTPNQCDNYLFDQKQKSFRLIENCNLDVKKINGTNYYYSYNHAGCSDLNWESHLSKIENFKLVDYGYMFGQGCDFDVKNNPQVIEIYKITNSEMNSKVLLKTLPYHKYITASVDKWTFLSNYWQENFPNFKR